MWPLERKSADHGVKGLDGDDVKFSRAVAYLLEGGLLANAALRESLFAVHREHHRKGLDSSTLRQSRCMSVPNEIQRSSMQ